MKLNSVGQRRYLRQRVVKCEISFDSLGRIQNHVKRNRCRDGLKLRASTAQLNFLPKEDLATLQPRCTWAVSLQTRDRMALF